MAIPFLGKIVDSLINKGSDLISEFITDPDKAAEFTHKFKMATLADAASERELEVEMYKAQQGTIQAELHQNDQYTKRTRPIIARRSFYAGLGYVFLTSLPEDGLVFGTLFTLMPWTFSWQVLLLLYSPALTYMGVRGFEKWKKGGST